MRYRRSTVAWMQTLNSCLDTDAQQLLGYRRSTVACIQTLNSCLDADAQQRSTVAWMQTLNSCLDADAQQLLAYRRSTVAWIQTLNSCLDTDAQQRSTVAWMQTLNSCFYDVQDCPCMHLRCVACATPRVPALAPSFPSCTWRSLRWDMSGLTPSDPSGWQRLTCPEL
eukprot:365969-Chlamydomonas_euryale.AAC.3